MTYFLVCGTIFSPRAIFRRAVDSILINWIRFVAKKNSAKNWRSFFIHELEIFL
jgi:hypothetical protein